MNVVAVMTPDCPIVIPLVRVKDLAAQLTTPNVVIWFVWVSDVSPPVLIYVKVEAVNTPDCPIVIPLVKLNDLPVAFTVPKVVIWFTWVREVAAAVLL